jgi:hypothetical protein
LIFPTFHIRFKVIHVKLKTLLFQFTRGPSKRIVQYISNGIDIYSLIEDKFYCNTVCCNQLLLL